MFDFLKRKTRNTQVLEKKSYSMEQIFRGCYTQDSSGVGDVTPRKALEYYDRVAPVSTAIDIIDDEFKVLNMQVKHEDGTVTKDDDIIKFLKHPNDDMVLVDFLETMGVYYLSTSENYMIAYGDVAKPPSEVIQISPTLVDVRISTKDGFIEEFRVTTSQGSQIVFKRDYPNFRFYTANRKAELWQIKGFDYLNIGRGRSKLNSVKTEAEQYLEKSNHNLGLLKNGMRSSGALSPKGEMMLTDDQFARLKEQVTNIYTGSGNAGKPLLLEGGFDFLEMGMNPKDMDFDKLSKLIEETIAKRYKVPLPLITLNSTARANMSAAKLDLYDGAVLPLANRMFSELTKFLGERFGMEEDSEIVPILDDITALQLRNNEQLKLKKELDIMTPDELRAGLGEKPLPEGGNTVYINNSLVPIGTQPLTDTQPPTETSKARFKKLAQEQKDIKGNRTYSDDEIDEIADKHGL